ncbi:MAG: hypothetical protein ACRD0K_21495 [Egibacteraceae bacterium]
MGWLVAVARSALASLAGLLIDDLVLVVGTALALLLTWALWRTGWVPARALGFILLTAVVATLATSLRRAAQAPRE